MTGLKRDLFLRLIFTMRRPGSLHSTSAEPYHLVKHKLAWLGIAHDEVEEDVGRPVAHGWGSERVSG